MYSGGAIELVQLSNKNNIFAEWQHGIIHLFFVLFDVEWETQKVS